MNHAPPTHIEAERTLVSAMLDAPRCIGPIVEYCRADWFADPALRMAYDVTTRRWRESAAIDLPIVMAECRGALDKPTLELLRMHLDQPVLLTEPAAKYWCGELKRTYHRRRAHYAAYDLLEIANREDSDSASINEAITALAHQLTDAREMVERGEWIDRTVDLIEAAGKRTGHLAGPSWGLTRLDDATGGIVAGKLVVIAGPTGGGKTALAMDCALSAAMQRLPALFWSLEMTGEEMMMRMIANTGPTNGLLAQRGLANAEEATSLQRGITQMRGAPIEIIDEVLPFDDMCSVIRSQVTRRGIGLVVIDYMQIIPPSNDRQPNKERELAEMSRKLARLCKDLNICIVALSQLNDAGNLSQARAIGHDAHIVLKLGEMDRSKEPPYDVEISITKNRGGPLADFKVAFSAAHYSFEDIEFYRD